MTAAANGIGSTAAPVVAAPAGQPAASGTATVTSNTTVGQPDTAAQFEGPARGVTQRQLNAVVSTAPGKTVAKAMSEQLGRRDIFSWMFGSDDRGIDLGAYDSRAEGLYFTRAGVRELQREDGGRHFKKLTSTKLQVVQFEPIRAAIAAIAQEISTKGEIDPSRIRSEYDGGLFGVVDDIIGG